MWEVNAPSPTKVTPKAQSSLISGSVTGNLPLMGMPSPNGAQRPQSGRRQGRVIPFGKYLLLERLAVGGMAEVYLGKSFGIEGFEKLIAIKRILPTMAEDDDFIEMFVDEAKIAGHLSHANIVPIYELGKIGESHYIAMEFVWGKDLLQIMNRFRRLRKRMPPAMVASIGSRMCEGLDYAHNKRDRRGNPLNLIHRDVSPQNVLVSYEGQVKVIDFGIAKAASRTTKTQAGVLKGKFGYMSPEQVRGLPIDHRSDIFAVGTCMYEMITGERLFLGESDFSTLEKVRNATVDSPSRMVRDLPPAMDAIIMRALAREPADRFQTAADLQHALQEFMAQARPLFSTSKLAAWMKTAFAAELTNEKTRIDSYSQIGRPSVLGGGAKPRPRPRAPTPPPVSRRAPAAPPAPAPGPITEELSAEHLSLADDEDLSGEATMISASPFEAAAAASKPVADGRGELENISEEKTTIFFSSDDAEEGVDEDGPTASGALGAPPPPAPAVFAKGAPPPRVSRPPPGRSKAPPAVPRPLAGGAARSASGMPPAPMPPAPVAQGPSVLPVSGALAPPDVPPSQRAVPTLEMNGQQVADYLAAQQAQSRKRLVIVLGAATVMMLLVGILGAVVAFGGGHPGSIEVHTVPSVAAAVTIDGVPRGRAPLRVDRVSVGNHTIAINANGYAPTVREVSVGAGTNALLEVALAASAGGAAPTAAQAGTHTGAGHDAIAHAEPPPPTPPPSGAHAQVEHTAPPAPAHPEPAPANHVAAHPEPAPRHTEVATTHPAPPPVHTTAPHHTTTPVRHTHTSEGSSSNGHSHAASGTLVVNTMPWTHVFVDGHDTGRNTPVTGLHVPAGAHQIGLRTADGHMHVVPVTVQAGQTARVVRRF